jgi:hypothetical protein
MQDQILELRAKGYGIRAIARALKIHRDTVRAYLSEEDAHRKIRGESGPPDTGNELELRSWQNSVDWAGVRKEQGRGVSLKVLWHEVCPEVRLGISKPLFCPFF